MSKQVKCPEGCLLSAGSSKAFTVSRKFEWHDDIDADVGVRKYCEQCGAKLVEVDND